MKEVKDYTAGLLYTQSDLFCSFQDSFLVSHSEALASNLLPKHQNPSIKQDHNIYQSPCSAASVNQRQHQLSGGTIDALEMLQDMSTGVAALSEANHMGNLPSPTQPHLSSHYSPYSSMMMPSSFCTGGGQYAPSHHNFVGAGHPVYQAPHITHGSLNCSSNSTESDPRELEQFAEKFKQRRIKLGVTQADVGKALANLRLPGVGALSQSTICRFESLTLSHNNMIALKPVLQTWLEEAEAQARDRRRNPDAPSVLPSGEKKRKRTSIAAPEKRSLEAYFSVQPRPSGEKIAAIAEKLDLKKNVVRVWFCNQRQKQKRMKFAAQHC